MTHALHLTTWYPVITEASGIFVVEQCAALRSAGVDVGLIYSRIEGLRSLTLKRLARGLPGFETTIQPVPTWGFKSWSFPGAKELVPSVNHFMLLNRYKAYVHARGKPDILHAHVALEAGSATREIAARTGLDYVITEHSTEILNGNMGAAREETARRVYQDACCVIAVSSALAERITTLCPTAKVRVINNLVRSSVFDLRLPTTSPRDRLQIVSIGTLSAHKRTHNAIAALARLPGHLKRTIDHHIVGIGSEMPRLSELAAEGGVNTIFHGGLSHERAMRLLAGADLFLHASAFETFGVVLAEAMALGVPIVATRCGGPQEFVDDNVGILVDVDDVHSTAAAIQSILSDLQVWKGRSDSISRQAFCQFHESRISAAILETYA